MAGGPERPPRVSVILPAYNQPGFLADAVRSVAVQTMEDLELLVIDDGSPTDLEPAFRAAAGGDPRLRYIRQENAGGSAARNHGIREAQGEWLAFLDHDDLWQPQKLERQLAWVTEQQAAMTFCRYRRFGTDLQEEPFPESAPVDVTLVELLQRTLVRTLSVVLVRRDALPADQWFRTDLAIANDIELYYRLAAAGRIVFQPEVLAEKRDHGANVSGDALASHLELVRVVDGLLGEPAARVPEVRRLAKKRLQRHLLGAAKAARRSGNPTQARTLYRRAQHNRPLSTRPWLGYLAACIGR